MTRPDAGSSESQGATRSELATLAPALNLEKISDQVADDLNTAILNYKDAKDRGVQTPDAGRIDSDLTRLNKRATALQDVIVNLQPTDLDRISAADLPGAKDLAQVVKKLEPQLVLIAEASEQAIQDSRQEAGGRRSDKEPLQKLILALMVIFERETGKEAGNSWDPRRDAYFGPFFDLVSGVIKIASPDEVFSNSILGSQITKALMKAKELSREYFARILARSSRQKDTVGQPPA